MDERRLSGNIATLLERVRLAAEKYQRETADIGILAVSKTRPAGDIRAAWDCGLDSFGESYLQEALPKMAQLADLPLTWHFIGPIQSNKTRGIAEHFHWVHSVDRTRIARRLSEQRSATLPPLQVCLQVNVSGEASKSGLPCEAAAALAAEVATLPRLSLRGLMAIPAPTPDGTTQRQAFARLKRLFDELRHTLPQLDTLSMGMSDDLEAAIAEGATLVRVGSAIFGSRDR